MKPLATLTLPKLNRTETIETEKNQLRHCHTIKARLGQHALFKLLSSVSNPTYKDFYDNVSTNDTYTTSNQAQKIIDSGANLDFI